MRELLLLILAPFAAGCYSVRPMSTHPAPNHTVDLLLTEAGSLALARSVGPNVARILGRVVAVRGDTMDLSLIEMTTNSAETFKLTGATVTVLPFQIGEIRRRRIDITRTAAAVGLGALGVSMLSRRVRDGGRP